MKYAAIDFESEAIEPRPKYPPEPVGVAIYKEDELPYYMAWGHPIENNIDRAHGTIQLAQVLEDEEYEFIFHNAPFDCSIIEEKLGLDVPWDRVHDTMLLAFLHNPFGELSLKPLAEQLLGEPPTEQDAVRDWLIRHGVCRSNDKHWGAYISKAPGALVGTYAIGDVTRTMKLFRHYTSLMTGDLASINAKMLAEKYEAAKGQIGDWIGQQGEYPESVQYTLMGGFK